METDFAFSWQDPIKPAENRKSKEKRFLTFFQNSVDKNWLQVLKTTEKFL